MQEEQIEKKASNIDKIHTIKEVPLTGIAILDDLGPYTRRKHDMKAQCWAYRTISDPIYIKLKGRHPEATMDEIMALMSDFPAPELIDIFKKGVQIVRDFIQTHDIAEKKYFFEEPTREKALEGITQILTFAQNASDEGGLTPKLYNSLCYALSAFVSWYKGESLRLIDVTRNSPFQIVEKLYEEYQQARITKSDFLPSILKGLQLDAPIFILFATPNQYAQSRALSMNTFVEQYVGYDYPGYLAIFDVHSNQENLRTKKDAHWSLENGTEKMLVHDLGHISALHRSEKKNERTSFIYSDMKAVYDAIHQQNSFSEQDHTVIVNGIFFLFHEHPRYYHLFDASNKRLALRRKYDRKGDPIPFIQMDHSLHILRRLNHVIEGFLYNDRTQIYNIEKRDNAYREETRDWEEILTAKNEYGNPFLPCTPVSQKKCSAFPLAQATDGTYHIIRTDSDGNLIDALSENRMDPLELTFVMDTKPLKTPKHEGHAIYLERLRLLAPTIRDAYKRFFERFLQLVENALMHGGE